MGLGDTANDWQVCMILSIAGGAGIAAGTYRFDFYSASAGICARFKFVGFGVGEGGDLSGTALPANLGPFSPWSSISCDRDFSVWDLNGSWGRLTSVVAGMGVGLGPVLITAAKPFLNSWFHSQDVGGFGTGGFGASGELLVGRWRFVSVSGNIPGSGGNDAA